MMPSVEQPMALLQKPKKSDDESDSKLEIAAKPGPINEQGDVVGSSKKKRLLRNLSRRGTEGLKEIVSCPICLERLNCPKMLPCQHSFCLSCLHNCREDDTRLRCPQCRAEHYLPKEGATGLPVNIYLQSILDLLESDTSVEDSPRCSTCQTVCSVLECEHCRHSFCPLCMNGHLEELKKQLGNIAEQLQMAEERIQKGIRTFKDHCDAIKTEINITGENKIRELMEVKSNLLKNVEDAFKYEETVCDKMAASLSTSYENLRSLMDNEFDSYGSANEKMSLFVKLHHVSSDLLSEVSSMDHGKLTFDTNLFAVAIERKTETNTEEEEENNELVALGATGGAQKQTTIVTNKNEPGIKELADNQSKFYRSKSFAPKSKLGLGLLQRPSGVAVSPWSNEIFIVAMDNHRIFVFDFDTGQLRRSFGRRGPKLGEFLCPFGIALSPTEQQLILVTDKWKHCVHIFSKNGKFVRQIGTKGRSPGHFRSPESICVDRNGKIYVCDTCNNRIQVLTQEGLFVLEIGTRSQIECGGGIVRQRSMFQEPTGIAVSPDGQNIVVCDFGNHRVHLFSITGQHVSTFGQKGVLRGQFIHPECVAVDNRGFIFIGDSGNGRVQICRPDGRFVKTFGSKGSNQGQFSWISGIAITESYDVVISDFKNHCVQIF